MGFAQGIQAGQAIARQWDPYAMSKGDPYSVMGHLTSRRRGGARGVQMGAAQMAIKEREMAIAERKQKMAEEQFEINRHRQAVQDRRDQLEAEEQGKRRAETDYQQKIQGIDENANRQDEIKRQSTSSIFFNKLSGVSTTAGRTFELVKSVNG